MKQLLDSLSGDVQSQGIKIDLGAWIDIGSEAWQKTPNEIKGAAYQAAKNCGWKDEAMKSLVLRDRPHLDSDIMDYTFDKLREFVEEYKIESVEIFPIKKDEKINFRDQERRKEEK